jgi:hypothetical protein
MVSMPAMPSGMLAKLLWSGVTRAKFPLDTFVERQRARGRGAAKFRLSELYVAGEAAPVGLLPKNHGWPLDRVS